MSAISPYLLFNGNCDAAFEFYRSVFGGEFAAKARYSEMQCDSPPPPEEANKVMHVSLPIGGTMLMGSDCPGGMPPVTVGNNFSVAFLPGSKEEAERVFNGLSGGGTVTMPLQDTFWGAYFGMCTDKFGINWQVNFMYEQPK